MDVEIWEQKRSGNQFVVAKNNNGHVVAWGWAHDYKYDGREPTETSMCSLFRTEWEFIVIKLSAVTPLGARVN